MTVPDEVLGRVRLAEFTGRTWAVQRIARWLAGSSPQLLVTGPPGAGKTTLAAYLVEGAHQGHRTACGALPPDWLCAAHFCQQHRFDSVTPQHALSAIATQLAATVPGYTEAVTGSGPATTVVIHQRVEQAVNSSVTGIGRLVLGGGESARQAFDALLRRPLRRLHALGRLPAGVVVLVDALDESVEGAPDPTLAGLIARELRDDPVPGLRLLATVRSGGVDDWFAGWDRVDLVEDEPVGGGDVGAYVARRLGGTTAGGRWATEHVTRASRGNFLYALHVVDDIVGGGRHSEADGAPLPQGLAGVYRRFLDREIAADRSAWRLRFRPVLGALAQSRGDGLTRAHLIRLTGLAPSAVDDTLRAAGSYLQGQRPDGPFQLHHQSVRDYLRAEGEHHVYPAEATAAVVRMLSDLWCAADRDSPERRDPYLLHHLLDHLHDALSQDPGSAPGPVAAALESVVTDPEWVMEAARTSGVEPLVTGLSRVVALLDGPPAAALALAQVLARQLHNLREWDASGSPGLLLQQVHYEATVGGHAATAAAASGELYRRGLPHWQIAWSKGPGASPHLLHTLRTDRDARPLAVTADGRHGVVGSAGGTITVWNLATGMVEHRLTGHTRDVTALFVSADATQIVSASDDGTVRVWQPGRGAPRPLVGDPFPIDALAVSPDHRFTAVVGRFSAVAVVLDTATGRRVRRLSGHSAGISAMAFTADGRRLLTGSYDGTARIWDVATGCCERVLGGHPAGHAMDVREVAPGGRQVAVVVRTGKPRVCVWDTATGRMDHLIPAAVDWQVMTTGDGRWAVTTEPDCSARLWDLATGRQVHELTGHAGDIHDVGVSADGRYAITGSGDGTARVWDLADGRATALLAGHRSPVWRVALTPDGRRAVTASADATAKVWGVAAQDGSAATLHVPSLEGRTGGGSGPTAYESALRIEAAAVGPDAAVTGHPDGRATVWDARTGDVRHVLRGHRDRVFAVALAPDGRQAGTGSADGTARVWDAGTGACLQVLDHGGGRAVWEVAFTSDGRWIVTVTASEVWVWHAGTGEPAHVLDHVRPLSDGWGITADQRRVVTGPSYGARAGAVSVWDIATGDRLRTMVPETAGKRLTIAPDGRRAVTWEAHDGAIEVWDVDGGGLLHVLRADRGSPAARLLVSPDGLRLLAGGGPGSGSARTVHVWSLDTGALEQRLSVPADWIDHVRSSPDGVWLTTSAGHEGTYLWDLTTRRRQGVLVVDEKVSTLATGPAHPAHALLCTSHGRVHYAVHRPGRLP